MHDVGGRPLTGLAIFDVASRAFSDVIAGQPPTNNLSLNWNSGVLVAPSDVLDQTSKALVALDVTNSALCTLTDANLALLGDACGSAFDPTTNLLVVGDAQNTGIAVVNLNGAAFNSSTPPCNLNEGGTPPNSILVPTATENFTGVSVNPTTHQAFMNDDTSNLALLSLPTDPIAQITSGTVTVQTAEIPASPTGAAFIFQTFPTANTIDVCNNLGYVRGADTAADYQFLVQVDLSAFAQFFRPHRQHLRGSVRSDERFVALSGTKPSLAQGDLGSISARYRQVR